MCRAFFIFLLAAAVAPRATAQQAPSGDAWTLRKIPLRFADAATVAYYLGGGTIETDRLRLPDPRPVRPPAPSLGAAAGPLGTNLIPPEITSLLALPSEAIAERSLTTGS